jgi:hypothetical protein
MGTPITGKLEVKALTAHNFILVSLEHQCSIARTNAYPECSVEDIRATADRMVACWNNHDALVKALLAISTITVPLKPDDVHYELVDAIDTATRALQESGLM